MDGKPRLLDRVREQIQLRHYSMRTEHAYVHGSADISSFTTSAIRRRWKPF